MAISYVSEAMHGSGAAIVCLYCDYKDQKTHSELELLSSVIRQLAEQRQPVPPVVKAFRDKYSKKRNNPTLDERISLARSLCLLFSQTYIFIDALVLFHYLFHAILLPYTEHS